MNNNRYEVHRLDRSFAILDMGGRSLDGTPLFITSFPTRSEAEATATALNQGTAKVIRQPWCREVVPA